MHDLPPTVAGADVAVARAVAILVHGRGRTASEMIALAERLALRELAYVALSATDGTWYPESFLAPVAKNQPHLDAALEHVEAVVCDLEARGHARERIALVGFSQGACLVAEYAYRHPTRWGALSILTGGVIGPADEARTPSGELRGTPIFLGCSDVDAWVPLERVKATAALFGAMGAAVDLRVMPGMEHVVSDEQIAATRELLAPLLG